MLFNSVEFIFYFLPAVVLVFYLARSEYRIVILLTASLFFYSWWNPVFTPLLIGSILMNYGVGRATIHWLGAGRARAAAVATAVGVSLNLAILAYFKYRHFLADALGLIERTDPAATLVLPLAISFFTFQQIAYLVDAWRGGAARVPFVRYAAFVSFFPQLIAGPIVRQHELLPQLTRLDAGQIPIRVATGGSLFCVGLFKKVVLADGMATFATPVFDSALGGRPIAVSDAWTATLAYHFQIYFDFSGYSTMAIGLALVFGIRLPLNFRSPYKAGSVIDFWRRWHMTLSRFLRDYLYIPLGGSRGGTARRYRNLAVTMLLGGLWHGADWGFVAWGGLHGLFLIINHAWHRVVGEGKLPFLVGAGLTFFFVAVAWVPFRTEGLAPALLFYETMLGLGDPCGPRGCATQNPLALVVPALVVAALVAWLLPSAEQMFGLDAEGRPSRMSLQWSPTKRWAVGVSTAFILAVTGIVTVGEGREFLYFQF